MADPYATESPDLSAKPSGQAPWIEAVSEAGGGLIAPDGGVSEGSFLVVHCRGSGTLAPFALLEPPMAVMLWLEHVGRGADAKAANALLRNLAEGGRPLYAIKHGWVAGPQDRDGATPIAADVIARLLAARDRVTWERDPDFDYQVPASVPGMGDSETRPLMPRLLYADHDRVYEHARLVEEKKRERGEIVAAIPGLDPVIVAASGWPPVPTGTRWKD